MFPVMEFNSRESDPHRRYNNHPFPTSSLHHTPVSDHPITDELWSRRSETRESIQRELMKEMIRKEILAAELERCRRVLDLGQPLSTRRFEPDMVRRGEPVQPENGRILMPVQGIYDGGDIGETAFVDRSNGRL